MNRICFVCLNAYKAFKPMSLAAIGGTEIQVATIAREFAKDDSFDVHCIVGDFEQAISEQYERVSVYRSFPLSKNLVHLVRAPFLLWRTLYSINPQTVVSSPAGPEVGLIGLYTKLFRKHFIFRVASDIDCTKEKQRSMGIVAGGLYRLGIYLADAIVVQHEGQRENMKKYYAKEAVIIKNGYSIPLRPTHNNSSSGKKREEILWIGSSRQVKRPDLFFELARALPQYLFTMILSRSGDHDIFTRSEKKAGTIANINFLGELAFDAVREHVAESKLLIGTSDYEGFPNTYVLAALSGVPVVSLRVNPEGYLTSSRTGVCANGSMAVMKSAIIKSMEDSAYYSQLSVAALRYARDHYNIRRIIARWISVIRTKDYSG